MPVSTLLHNVTLSSVQLSNALIFMKNLPHNSVFLSKLFCNHVDKIRDEIDCNTCNTYVSRRHRPNKTHRS